MSGHPIRDINLLLSVNPKMIDHCEELDLSYANLDNKYDDILTSIEQHFSQLKKIIIDKKFFNRIRNESIIIEREIEVTKPSEDAITSNHVTSFSHNNRARLFSNKHHIAKKNNDGGISDPHKKQIDISF